MKMHISPETKSLLFSLNATTDDLLEQFVVPAEPPLKYVSSIAQIASHLFLVSIDEEEEVVLFWQLDELSPEMLSAVYQSLAYREFVQRTGYTGVLQ